MKRLNLALMLGTWLLGGIFVACNESQTSRSHSQTKDDAKKGVSDLGLDSFPAIFNQALTNSTISFNVFMSNHTDWQAAAKKSIDLEIVARELRRKYLATGGCDNPDTAMRKTLEDLYKVAKTKLDLAIEEGKPIAKAYHSSRVSYVAARTALFEAAKQGTEGLIIRQQLAKELLAIDHMNKATNTFKFFGMRGLFIKGVMGPVETAVAARVASEVLRGECNASAWGRVTGFGKVGAFCILGQIAMDSVCTNTAVNAAEPRQYTPEECATNVLQYGDVYYAMTEKYGPLMTPPSTDRQFCSEAELFATNMQIFYNLEHVYKACQNQDKGPWEPQSMANGPGQPVPEMSYCVPPPPSGGGGGGGGY